MMKKPSLMPALILSSLTLGFTAHADRTWNSGNDPHNLDGSYKLNFNALKDYTKGDATLTKDGKQSYKGWSDSYFPMNRGYIADRWQVPEEKFQFKKYKLPANGFAGVRILGESGINLLSPAEKFDIIRGDPNFTLTRKIIKDTEPKEKFWWKGQCDGWVTASLNIDEPRPITFISPKTKIAVPLTSSDIKGLLAYYYAEKHQAPAMYVGKSCRANKKLLLDIDGSCKDINAGAFHVVLVNEIALKHRGFAMDRDASTQVWNQPILKFETAYFPRTKKSSKASEKAAREIDVKTTITYANELYDTDDESLEDDVHAAPSVDAVIGTAKQKYRTKTYEYVIELDDTDTIIGGEWTGGDHHPDMIWRHQFALPGMAYDKDGNPDDWKLLKDIVKQATAYVGEKAEEAPAETPIPTATPTPVPLSVE